MRLLRFSRLGLGSALLAAAAGCGAANEPAARDPSAGATEVLAATPARTYGGDPEPPLASDAPTASARTLFESSLGPELRGHLRSEGWLDFGARAAAAIAYQQEEAPTRSTLRWVLWRAGVTAIYDVGYANTWTLKGGFRRGNPAPDVTAEVDGDVARFVRKLAPRPEERIYGIARYASGGTSTSQAILVATVPVEVEPFAKSWTPGSDVTITIRDLRGHAAPLLYADLGAEVKTLVMTPRGPGASVTFKAPPTPGRVMIEVRAEQRHGGARAQVTVLHAPLWVGVPEAASARELLGTPLPAQPNPEAMGAAIREAYGAARARAGVGPFASDPRLTALATAAATRMSQNAGGPISPDQLREAGFAGAFNVHQQPLSARDYGDYAAIQLSSPYAKWMLIQRDATLAVAVIPVPGDAGGRLAVVEALAWPRR